MARNSLLQRFCLLPTGPEHKPCSVPPAAANCIPWASPSLLQLTCTVRALTLPVSLSCLYPASCLEKDTGSGTPPYEHWKDSTSPSANVYGREVPQLMVQLYLGILVLQNSPKTPKQRGLMSGSIISLKTKKPTSLPLKAKTANGRSNSN